MSRNEPEDRENFLVDLQTRFSTELSIWEFQGIKVYYTPKLDGGGRSFGPFFVDYINEDGGNPRVKKAFEWCAGPGFMGFALLAAGICEKLCLADINPDAIECIKQTVAANGLEDKVSYYLSDNMDSVPPEELFDLVVSNPPNYFRINPAYPGYDLLKHDLRPNDPDWKIHRRFYSQIAKHMQEGGYLLINEIAPLEAAVFLDEYPYIPYDIRDRPAIDDFKEMIENGGLIYEGTPGYKAMGVEMGVVISRRPARQSR